MILNPKESAKKLLRRTGEFSGVQGVRPTHTHQLYFYVVCRGRVNTAGPTKPGEKGLPTRLDVGRAPISLTSKKREAHGAQSCVPTVQVMLNSCFPPEPGRLGCAGRGCPRDLSPYEVTAVTVQGPVSPTESSHLQGVWGVSGKVGFAITRTHETRQEHCSGKEGRRAGAGHALGPWVAQSLARCATAGELPSAVRRRAWR